MKIFTVLLTCILAQRPKCEWVHGDSGEHVTCPDKHFINGICGSGKEANCEFGAAGKHAFGVQCCPETRTVRVGVKNNCQWFGESTGKNAGCKQSAKTAFGRCETSNSGNGGQCNKMGHQTECCNSDFRYNVNDCKWTYGENGEKLLCPEDQAAIGFCGVNKKAGCGNGKKFSGIRCCPAL